MAFYRRMALQRTDFRYLEYILSAKYSLFLSFIKKKVYVPDFLEGDPLPNDAFESGTVC